MDRRRFLQGSSASLASLTIGSVAKAVASERVRVGMIGAGGRASALNRLFASDPNAEIVTIAEIDSARLGDTVANVTKLQGREPHVVRDFRHLLDDHSIDAIVVGTPDHWHAIPTILACQAGKDVYVEKPDGHNMVEGQRMVAAMKKHQRVVQLGSQHRSTNRLKSALDYIRSGALGHCLVAKAWENARQGSIGNPPDSLPPHTVDYDMWLGPAKKRPFNKNRFHGRWRWFHDYGSGDLGNDGVHRLDMAFAALNAACESQGDPALSLPTKISATGGKWYFDDMQEWPDTLQVTYEYQSETPKILTYEMRIWTPYPYYGESEGAVVYGDNASMVIGNKGWRVFGEKGKLLKEVNDDSDATPHVADFLNCIKTRGKPACDLETVGHPASILCHAGNIAARVGTTLTLDPTSETFLDNDAANKLRGREEWRKPWILPEV